MSEALDDLVTENDMSEQTLWICGKLRGHAADGTPAWDLQGVFDTEDAATAACQDGNDFIGPVPLNKPLPQAATDWPGCRYPMASMATTVQRDIEQHLTSPEDRRSLRHVLTGGDAA